MTAYNALVNEVLIVSVTDRFYIQEAMTKNGIDKSKKQVIRLNDKMFWIVKY